MNDQPDIIADATPLRSNPWFITMEATPETTMFDWFRMVEELKAAISFNVPEHRWETFRAYGPSTDDALPCIAIKADLTIESLGNISAYLAAQKPWITLPIYFYPSDWAEAARLTVNPTE